MSPSLQLIAEREEVKKLREMLINLQDKIVDPLVMVEYSDAANKAYDKGYARGVKVTKRRILLELDQFFGRKMMKDFHVETP